MTRQDKHRNDIVADINITPFTDVVLVLLIIFMVATPIIVGSGVKVNVPKALTSKTDVEKFLTVTIDAQENIYLNEQKITVEQLSKMIRGTSGQGAKVMLKVNGDKSIKYRTVIKVISAARDAGVVRYLLVTEKINTGTGG
jgi:biopolymer transport protein ExbD